MVNNFVISFFSQFHMSQDYRCCHPSLYSVLPEPRCSGQSNLILPELWVLNLSDLHLRLCRTQGYIKHGRNL